MDRTRTEYIAALKMKLDKLNIAVAELAAQAAEKSEKGQEDPRRRFEQALASLEYKKKVARERLAALEGADDGDWSELRKGAEGAWLDLSDTLEKTRDEFGDITKIDPVNP